MEVYRHARLDARNNWPSALCDSGVWIERGQPFRELGGASVPANPDLRPLWINVPSHTRSEGGMNPVAASRQSAAIRGNNSQRRSAQTPLRQSSWTRGAVASPWKLPKNFAQRIAQGFHDPPDLDGCGAIRRHEHNDITDGTCEYSAPRHRFADANAGALPQTKRLTCPPIAHEFDADHQTDLADIADVRRRPQRLQFLAQRLFEPLPRANRGGALQNLQAREGRRRTELVRCIAVAVEKSFEFFVFAEELIENLLGRESSSHWQVATAHAFGEREEIRLHALVLAGEQSRAGFQPGCGLLARPIVSSHW